MKCKDCAFWVKRELPEQLKKQKQYYPAGRCYKYQTLTTENVQCRFGEEKLK